MSDDRPKKDKLYMRLPLPGGVILNLDISKVGTLGRFPPTMDPIFTLYGRIVLEWSCTEQELEFLIHKTFFNEFVPGIEDTERPQNLKKKIQFLRKAFRPTGPLKEVSSTVRRVLTETYAVGKERHVLAHSHLLDIRSDENEYYLHMGAWGKDYRVFSGSDMEQLLKRIYQCQNDLVSISWNYSSLFRRVRPTR